MQERAFIDVESGEEIFVEMTPEQFLTWLRAWVKDLDMGDLEESDELIADLMSSK